ncbi:hypothetical protein [Nodosilinea sp. PGN35]|uniref:hypothetical protein n=1 Tax=Nodosilinea sp. PGN35 TaxID=3020489 RepID=UPI0023B2FB61|nr:hypothetical protein [Nodosilinea sp. TSF1-S3]MDF0365982.1 hypothetical protein [Nodosilinea sp. TSF1-S3]
MSFLCNCDRIHLHPQHPSDRPHTIPTHPLSPLRVKQPAHRIRTHPRPLGDRRKRPPPLCLRRL